MHNLVGLGLALTKYFTIAVCLHLVHGLSDTSYCILGDVLSIICNRSSSDSTSRTGLCQGWNCLLSAKPQSTTVHLGLCTIEMASQHICTLERTYTMNVDLGIKS